MSEVEETVTTLELDEETFEEIYRVSIILCLVWLLVQLFRPLNALFQWYLLGEMVSS